MNKLEEILNKLTKEGRNPTVEELLTLESLQKEIDALYETILQNQANFVIDPIIVENIINEVKSQDPWKMEDEI